MSAPGYLHCGVDLVDHTLDQLQAQRLHEQELDAVAAQLGARRNLAQRNGALLRWQAARGQ